MLLPQKQNINAMKSVFITVGTTKFRKLVDAITKSDIINAFKELGFSNIQIQTGPHFDGPNVDPNIKNVLVNQKGQSLVLELKDFNISIKYDQYFEDFEEQIEKADLVISHAGAGSCLDVLRLKKPLIVVVNEELMDNHQIELAHQLQKNGYSYFCFCKTLLDTLHKDFNVLVPYPELKSTSFSDYLNKCCGFIQ